MPERTWLYVVVSCGVLFVFIILNLFRRVQARTGAGGWGRRAPIQEVGAEHQFKKWARVGGGRGGGGRWWPLGELDRRDQMFLWSRGAVRKALFLFSLFFQIRPGIPACGGGGPRLREWVDV